MHNDWAANIVWIDFTKLGRVTGSDLNDSCDLLQTLLVRKPDHSCAVVIAPYLTSQTAPEHSGPHSEIRTDRAKKIIMKHPVLICSRSFVWNV